MTRPPSRPMRIASSEPVMPASYARTAGQVLFACAIAVALIGVTILMVESITLSLPEQHHYGVVR